MDLDDDELRATRRINGTDKNVGSIEDIEGLKRLFYANALTQYGKRKIIEYYEQRIKELEEKWDKDTHTLQNTLDLANADKINNYIPKSKIKEIRDKAEAMDYYILSDVIDDLNKLLEGE